MDNDYEIYEGKTFSSLCRDIVTNSEEKKNQVDILITDLRGLIKTATDAMMIVPLLKEYYDVSIRNDEQLIKLAAVIQRIISGKVVEGGDGNVLLTEEEKKQLMASVDSAVKEMGKPVPDKTEQIEKIKAAQQEIK